MKVLLVNSNRLTSPWPVIPNGLCAVASSLEEAGHHVRVLDLCLVSDTVRTIKNAILGFTPDFIGIGIRNIDNGYGYNATFFLEDLKDEVISIIKKKFSGPIIIGGAAVSISGVEMLDYLGLDLAVRGDGEVAMVDLIESLVAGKSLEGIHGVIYRDGDHIIAYNEPARMTDLNSLPLVRPHHYLDMNPYRHFGSPLQIQTKRGCPLNCAYCIYNTIEGKLFRLRDPHKVAYEISTLVRETGINHIIFTDSVFNIPLDHAKAVLRAIVDTGLDLKLENIGLNPGAVDEELIDLMKRAGFRDVGFGVDSASDEVLNSLGKNYSKKDILYTYKLLKRAGIPTSWYLLLGSPGESESTLIETLETVADVSHKWDLVIIGVGVRPYKGSPVARQMLRNCKLINQRIYPLGLIL